MAVEWKFQVAVFEALSADAGIMSAVTGVYDRAPQEADAAIGYPFVTIGKSIVTERDTDGVVGFSILQRIHTQSASSSMRECKEIQGLIFGALHRAQLSVTGHNCFSLLREDSDVTIRPDGRTEGICEYRALIHQI